MCHFIEKVITNMCHNQDLLPIMSEQAAWDKDHNQDAPSRILTGLPRSRPAQNDRSRRDGRPAFFRHRLDKVSHHVVHDYMDARGKWAPAAYITFDNGGHALTPEEVATAYIVADGTRERINAEWNRDLCVYLWRVRMYNYT